MSEVASMRAHQDACVAICEALNLPPDVVQELRITVTPFAVDVTVRLTVDVLGTVASVFKSYDVQLTDRAS